MSGTGKSAALQLLGERGHRVVDTDTDHWSCWVTSADGSRDWIWREDAIDELLSSHGGGNLFVAGCKTNQGRFYPQFDQVVLLSAPVEVLLARIASRTSNPYGKRSDERAMILHHLAEVEPQLRATADFEIDASAPCLRSSSNSKGWPRAKRRTEQACHPQCALCTPPRGTWRHFPTAKSPSARDGAARPSWAWTCGRSASPPSSLNRRVNFDPDAATSALPTATMVLHGYPRNGAYSITEQQSVVIGITRTRRRDREVPA